MDEEQFEKVVAAFSKDKAVTSGKMMASQGLKIDGKIFAMLRNGRLVTKLPKARSRDESILRFSWLSSV